MGNILSTILQASSRQWLVGWVMVIALTGFAAAQNSGSEAPASGGASGQQSDSDGQPGGTPVNLETNQALNVVMSPFRVGHLSLISFSAYQGYDSNPDLLKTSAGTEYSAFNALLVYSISKPAWNLDLQYEPSAFVSPKLVAKNLIGNAADLQVARRLSETWNLGIGEHFRYSPNVQSSIQGNTIDLGGVNILIPFLTSSRSLLVNTVSGLLSHRLSEKSTVVFHADQSYIRLSNPVGATLINQLPAEDTTSTDAGFSWSRTLGLRDTIHATYEYRTQLTASVPTGTANFHLVGFGWSHVLKPSVRISMSAGPGFSNPGSKTGRTTVQGSFQIAKEVRNGGIGFSFSRSDAFSGVVSNSFNNQYAVRIDRRFGARLNFTGLGSYVQQQVYGGHTFTGQSASVEIAWFTTRNVSIFGQARYLQTHGQDLSIAPRKILTVGVRWSWVPEKP